MKHITLTAALATVVLLGFNAPSTAFSPQNPSAQARTQSMSFGATEAVNFTMHDAQSTYTVPTGKVLHLEHVIWALEGDATHQSFVITPGNEIPGTGDLLFSFGLGTDSIWTPTRPIRVVGDGNAGVRILKNPVVDWRDAVVVGYLTNS